MVVEIQRNGRSVTGLHVGSGNVRRYFPRGLGAVDLHLDHLEIRCALLPSFWNGKPQISDPRLTAWLEAKDFAEQSHAAPIQLSLVPAEGRSFRLQLADPRPFVKPKSFPTAS